MLSKMASNSKQPHATNKLSILVIILLPFLYASLLHLPPSSLFNDTVFWFLISNSIIIVVAADSGIFNPSNSSSNDMYDEYIKHSKPSSAFYPVPAPAPAPVMTGTEKREETHPPTNINDIHSKSPSTLCLVPVPIDTKSHDTAIEKSGETNYPHTSVNDKHSKSPGMLCPAPAPDTTDTETEKRGTTKSQTVVVNIASEKDHQSHLQSQCKRSLSELTERKKVKKNSVARSKSSVMEGDQYLKMSDEELNRRVEEFITRFNREIRLQEKMSSTSTAVC